MRAGLLLPCLCTVPIILALEASAGAGASRFVTNTPDASSAPENLLVVGDSLYFAADDGIHGKELWRLDAAGQAHLVGDFFPGPEGSQPRNLVALGNRVCFVGLRHHNPRRKVLEFVWSTSGTAVGTRCHGTPKIHESVPGDITIVALGQELWGARTMNKKGREYVGFDGGGTVDTVPGAVGGVRKAQEYFALLGDRLIFTVQAGAISSRALWVHQPRGPRRGAYPLLPEHEGKAGLGFPMFCAVTNGRLWFAGSRNPNSGVELFLSDGTEGGTVFVKDINPGLGDSMPKDFASHEGIVYFQAHDGAHGIELWCSDGTETGTRLVKDINPGPPGSNPYFMRSIGGLLLFAAVREDVGTELWRTDGTPEGTQLVKDIYPGFESSSLYQPTPYKGLLLFAANHPEFGEELWQSDGTPSGTYLVKDIHPGPGLAEPYYLTVFQDLVYFCANDGVYGEELWRSDGTAAGTVMAADIRPETHIVRSGNPTHLMAANGGIYFAADDLEKGNELWWSDVESLETYCLADIRPGPLPSDPDELLLFDGTLLFTADDGVHGRELWRVGPAPPPVDVTFPPLASHQAAMVSDLREGPEASHPRLLLLTDTGLFFAACGTGALAGQAKVLYHLSEPNGLPEKMLDLADLGITGQIVNLRLHANCVYVCTQMEDSSMRFAVLDPATEETEVVSCSLHEAVTWEAVLAQATENDRRGRRSHTSTSPDALLQCYLSLPALADRHVRYQGHWYFAARTAAHGVELWAANEDIKSARLVRDCFPGPASGSPSELVVAGGQVFFAADHPAKGRQLWTTDGTAQGTYVVHDHAGHAPIDIAPQLLTAYDEELFYSARGPGERYEGRRILTKCAGAKKMRVVVPAIEPDRHWPHTPRDLTATGPYLYFTAEHPAIGRELWRYSTREIDDNAYTAYTMVHNVAVEPRYTLDAQVLEHTWHKK